jgi:alpha-glucuronidase
VKSGESQLLPPDEDGYQLWLRYAPVVYEVRREEYRQATVALVMPGSSPTLTAARDELGRALGALLGRSPDLTDGVTRDGTVIAGTPESLPLLASLALDVELVAAGEEGYAIVHATVDGRRCTVIAANHDIGVLYGVFAWLRGLQTERPLSELCRTSAPRIARRMLNHWDNLDRSVERGYAGCSLWDWHQLPDHLDPRYRDYARANASVGINSTVLTNVNANALVLTQAYLRKAAALADVFRPYGIRVYLTARFSAPVELGDLDTADPLDARVVDWWKQKANEIYRIIPDFGGFLVKANSEGQPGPQDYHRSHAEGANLLANALAPHGGIVIWRAFVYDASIPEDRAKQAHDEFVPLDGKFLSNVALQVKNGPIDFQPREPYHPLFGATPATPLVAEFQITQEYLGCATHLVYLAPLFKETLCADTHARGHRSTVAKVVDGTLFGQELTAIAGVSNVGNERNWCGHLFAQANWYAFGRLAWNHQLTVEQIADEWIGMTFTNDDRFVGPVRAMMLLSREAVVNYMTPLGLHHQMAWHHHYGPGPWITAGRPDWTSAYYHRADAEGIGFDRSSTGSNAVAQYHAPRSEEFGTLDSCPLEYLLWFHHVPWTHELRTGRTLWNELCHRYQLGVAQVRELRRTWSRLEDWVDAARFEHVRALLAIQEKEAAWWRDACVLYFQTFSRQPIPPEVEPAAHSLDYYVNLVHRYVPGIPDQG